MTNNTAHALAAELVKTHGFTSADFTDERGHVVYPTKVYVVAMSAILSTKPSPSNLVQFTFPFPEGLNYHELSRVFRGTYPDLEKWTSVGMAAFCVCVEVLGIVRMAAAA